MKLEKAVELLQEIYKKYQLAFQYIEAQMEADN